MENEKNPNYSTQKKEPINFSEKPKTVGTPAHPFPNFLPKPIALIVIVLIATALLSGLVFTVYNLGKSSVLKELNPTAPAIPPKDPVIYEPTPTSSSSADMSDWKTYRNQAYKFSIKYPIEWSVTQADDLVPDKVGCAWIGEDDTRSKTITICFANEKLVAIFPEIVNNPKTTKSSLNGYEIYKKGSSPEDVYFANSDKSFVTINQGTLSNDSLFDQILSTFKFTE